MLISRWIFKIGCQHLGEMLRLKSWTFWHWFRHPLPKPSVSSRFWELYHFRKFLSFLKFLILCRHARLHLHSIIFFFFLYITFSFAVARLLREEWEWWVGENRCNKTTCVYLQLRHRALNSNYDTTILPINLWTSYVFYNNRWNRLFGSQNQINQTYLNKANNQLSCLVHIGIQLVKNCLVCFIENLIQMNSSKAHAVNACNLSCLKWKICSLFD